MKTDEELSERLRRASSALRVPVDPVERLHRRRAIKRRRERVTAMIVAMVLFAGAAGGTLFALRPVWDGHRDVPGSGEWTPNRSLELQPGQYFYLRSANYGFDDSVNVQQTWWAPDGSGELRYQTNRPDKYTPYPLAGIYEKGEFPPPYQADLSALSTDPNVLGEELREQADRDGISLWRTILNLLDFERSPEALPELRASLFDVAAGLDGVSRQDGVTDPVGRQAVALQADEIYQGTDDSGQPTPRTMHWELFFDPGTHQLMAEAVGFGGPPVPFLILQSAIVDSRGADPTDEQLLFPNPVHEFVFPPQPSPTLP